MYNKDHLYNKDKYVFNESSLFNNYNPLSNITKHDDDMLMKELQKDIHPYINPIEFMKKLIHKAINFFR